MIHGYCIIYQRFSWYVEGVKLHQAHSTPDWLQVDATHRTKWQRLAAQTHGIITPGNAVSFIGVVLVLVGLGYIVDRQPYVGLVLVGIGRLADIFDGMVAERTGTKSQLGEAVDAASDKVGLFMTLLVFVLQHLAPLALIIFIGVQAICMAGIGIVARIRHIDLHPLREGKLATVAFWLALFLFVITTLLNRHAAHHIALGVQGFGYAVMAISLVLGVYAVVKSIAGLK